MFCGEGIPTWAATNEKLFGIDDSSFPWPLEGVLEKGWKLSPADNASGVFASALVPSRANCGKHGWGNYLATYSLLANVAQLYTNSGPKKLRDKFAQYWAKLAAAFKNEPNVIGFELMNEPDPVLSVYSFPGKLDGEYLQPFYDAVAAAIRAVDPERMIVFEPTTWSDEDAKSKLGPAVTHPTFSHVPGGEQYVNTSAYAFHYYSWVNKPDQTDYFKARGKDLAKLKNPVQMVTEWNLGGCSSRGTNCDCTEMDIFDQFKVSVWMAWDYKSFVPKPEQTPFVPTCTGCGSGLINNDAGDGTVRISYFSAYALARSYPIAIQGRLQEPFVFNWTSNELRFTYRMDPTIGGTTEVYLNTALNKGGPQALPGQENVTPRYQQGQVDVVVSPSAFMEWAWAANKTDIIEITPKAGAKPGPVTVTISPKPLPPP